MSDLSISGKTPPPSSELRGKYIKSHWVEVRAWVGVWLGQSDSKQQHVKSRHICVPTMPKRLTNNIKLKTKWEILLTKKAWLWAEEAWWADQGEDAETPSTWRCWNSVRSFPGRVRTLFFNSEGTGKPWDFLSRKYDPNVISGSCIWQKHADGTGCGRKKLIDRIKVCWRETICAVVGVSAYFGHTQLWTLNKIRSVKVSLLESLQSPNAVLLHLAHFPYSRKDTTSHLLK